ncbi:MAG: hypothetical protein A2X77_03170 [Gammaproteobacteria bacterium GWE2_42_36]|nr:MAG: hypothetical protein A2X77_03170 [Gammaproteobacteria bacterium GWE2_42_36]HCU04826.1 cell division protein ZapD [Coxiellaceae bacterium]
MIKNKEIIYEQPLNELIRVTIRLEHLLSQLAIYLSSTSDRHTQTIMHLMVDLLNLLDRPDLKSKLTQEFTRLTTVLAQIPPSASHINRKTLTTLMGELKRLSQHFLHTPGKIANTLRENDFLAALRQYLMSPGGDSCIDAPHYFYWLNQPADTHHKQIQTWMGNFEEIQAATTLLLKIVRDSTEPEEVTATNGFFHTNLDPQASVQLIRVTLPTSEKLYPEISVGRHRISVRFVIPDMNKRPAQTTKDICFKLTKCTI